VLFRSHRDSRARLQLHAKPVAPSGCAHVPQQRSRRAVVCMLVTLAKAIPMEQSPADGDLDRDVIRALVRRGLLELGVSIAGVGVLAAFAAIGAVGLAGQRCAELFPARGGRVA